MVIISFFAQTPGNLEVCTKVPRQRKVFCALSLLAISEKLTYNSLYIMHIVWAPDGFGPGFSGMEEGFYMKSACVIFHFRKDAIP